MYGRLQAGILSCAIIVAAHGTAMAADTTETWDPRAADVDFYLGYDGMGLEARDGSAYGFLMLGYGFVERFSGYLGVSFGANGSFTDGTGEIHFGLYGTPVETDHFDLDLFLDVGALEAGFRDFHFTPSLEMNFDLDPDRTSWGMYLRAGLPVHGFDVLSANPDNDTKFHVETTVGTYWTVVDGHQLLLELDLTFHPLETGGGRVAEVGGLELGYNVCLVEDCAVEMINHVYLDIPQGGESFSAGLGTGFILTIPAER